MLMAMFLMMAGHASQYAPGVMDSVIRTRQAGLTGADMPEDLPDVDGFVAMERCDRINDIIYIRPEGQDEWETFMVADCSGHAETTRWMRRNRILVEVDAETARRWDTVGRLKAIEVLIPRDRPGHGWY